MADIKFERALSKELLLLEELEADEVDDVESSVKSELVFCKLEINMNFIPLRANSPSARCRKAEAPRVTLVDCILMRNEYGGGYKRGGPIP